MALALPLLSPPSSLIHRPSPPPPSTGSSIAGKAFRETGARSESGFFLRDGVPPRILQDSGTCPGKNGGVSCMAHPRRVKMVAQQIKRELGDMILTDTVLQHAVLPESALGADMYLSSLTTISDVEVSKDLQVAKVYVSIYGDDRGKEIVMEGLKSKTKYVRAGLGKRMSLRMTPEVLAILDKLGQERKEREGRQMYGNDAEDDNWNDVLEDEGDEAMRSSRIETRE